jgi:hypothetical protein
MKQFLFVFSFVSFLFSQTPEDNKAFLPDSAITPGAIIDSADNNCICQKGYSASVRNVPKSRKDSAYSLYNIKHHSRGEYEIDHLISLELGGSNDIKNLWPESYLTEPWNAHKKDRLENRLHRLVCIGKITLKEAQYEIAHDWIKAYKKYIEKQ